MITTITAEGVKEHVTVPEILSHYGYPLGRNHRCPCPIHGGHDNNFSYNNAVYKCFVCNRGGDVIQLVQDIFGIDFRAALNQINADFALGLDAPDSSRAGLDEQIRLKRESERAQKRALEDQLRTLTAKRRELHAYTLHHHPTAGDEPDEAFFKAISDGEYIDYQIETLENRLKEMR